MKKNIGSVLSLYPVPVAVIGAMVNDEPTWTLAAHMGIIGHDHIMISLVSAHYINEAIRKTGQLTINLVDRALLPKADYAGSVSGKKTSKKDLFKWEPAPNGAPMIESSPLTIACTVEDVYPTKGFDNFICTIDSTLARDDCLDEQGKIDYEKVKPILFEFPTYQYLETGNVVGPCLSFKNEISQ